VFAAAALLLRRPDILRLRGRSERLPVGVSEQVDKERPLRTAEPGFGRRSQRRGCGRSCADGHLRHASLVVIVIVTGPFGHGFVKINGRNGLLVSECMRTSCHMS
jgi:hypothetical protein